MIQNEHVCAICCRPEVGDDVISSEYVDTFGCYSQCPLPVRTAGSHVRVMGTDYYACVKLWAAIFSSFRDSKITEDSNPHFDNIYISD